MWGSFGGGLGGGGFGTRRFEEQYHCYSVSVADKAHLEVRRFSECIYLVTCLFACCCWFLCWLVGCCCCCCCYSNTTILYRFRTNRSTPITPSILFFFFFRYRKETKFCCPPRLLIRWPDSKWTILCSSI